jgi:RimJ/RimL family protein N-acetyltransferase
VFDLGLTLREGGALIGRAGFGWDAAQRSGKLWYVANPAHHGRGYVNEACRELLRFGFEELGAHRFWVDIDPRNAPSIRVAERLGMRREALHVENFWCKGEWTDTLILALLEREWRLSAGR